jgi:chaperone BCS1
VPEDSVILFEDIDCMNSSTRHLEQRDGSRTQVGTEDQASSARNTDKLGVSLSGLLNVLDGFSAPENVVYAMTTNDITALDAALLRPGRIDYKLYLGEASESQKIELYRRFFPDASEVEARAFAQAHWTDTMAEFQGLLLALEQEYRTNEVVVEHM